MRDFAILVVDDIEENLYVIEEILANMEGIKIYTASSGEQALTIPLKNKIDLILLDIQLPDINGYEIAEHLKSKNSTMDIPIVFVTAIFRSDEFVKKGYQIGGIDYLFKPLDEDLLIRKIEFYKTQHIKRMNLKSDLEIKNEELNHKISELTKTQEQLKYYSYHDQLTTLYNRRYFHEKYDEIFDKKNYPISVIMGDLVGLKVINDGFGHKIGDLMLQKTADLLLETVNHGKVFRWGGDEFLLCSFNTTEEQITESMQQLTTKLSSVMIDDKFTLSISMGHAVMKDENASLDEVLKVAEDRMYVNKLRTDGVFKHSVIDTLHSSLMEKNFETEEHAERMKNLVIEFSKIIDLSRYEVDQLVLLTSLHDIGKIAISESILSKPGPLNDEEWEEVKKHCEVGYRLCSTIPELAPISNVVLSHHEKWDGTGYPQGLKGKEIPFLSRIITVVDSYDVMTNNRPYKKGMTKEAAINELKRCSGTQFDPFIVKKFIEMIS